MKNAQVRIPTVLITGASTGLGLALSRLLIKKNQYRLVLTARKESLERFRQAEIFESENLWLRPLDVLEDQERKAIIYEIEQKWDGLDILVNNAGFTFRSVLEHVEQSELLKQMLTNFWAPMELIRLSLPGMRARRYGKIINISSVGGMMAMPTMSIYSASKFALEGATEALYYEVRPWNISVSLIEPGFIKSDAFLKVRYTSLSDLSAHNPRTAYYGHYYFMSDFIEKLMRFSPATPERIAKKIAKVIESRHPPLRVSATPDAYLFDLLRRFLPRRFYHWLLYRFLPYADDWGDERRLQHRLQLKTHGVPNFSANMPLSQK